MWHPLREDHLQYLENSLKSQIGSALSATVLCVDNGTQEDNSRIVLVPCIITGRAEDCIRDKLVQLAGRGRETYLVLI